MSYDELRIRNLALFATNASGNERHFGSKSVGISMAKAEVAEQRDSFRFQRRRGRGRATIEVEIIDGREKSKNARRRQRRREVHLLLVFLRILQSVLSLRNQALRNPVAGCRGPIERVGPKAAA